MPTIYEATCRHCGRRVRSGQECAHIRVNEHGQVYEQGQHPSELDQYHTARAVRESDAPEPAPVKAEEEDPAKTAPEWSKRVVTFTDPPKKDAKP